MRRQDHGNRTGWNPAHAGIALLLALLMLPGRASAEPAPEFHRVAAGDLRKQAFIAYLAPMIDAQNAWILDNRALLEAARLELQQGVELDADTVARIAVLTEYYGLNPKPPAGPPTDTAALDSVAGSAAPGQAAPGQAAPVQAAPVQAAPMQAAPEQAPVDMELIDRLLFRGDVIPPSLALAQAANESGWGTSRFARDGNNFFGEWCLTPGCGMVPGRRAASATFEVESFASVEDAVRSYFRTLNRAVAFRRLRELRAEARMQGAPLRGAHLADGLHSYSAIGQDYIDGLRSIIATNQLDAYDQTLPTIGTAEADSATPE